MSKTRPAAAAHDDAAGRIEHELKLAGEAAALRAAFKDGAFGTGKATAQRLENVYYDTPDLALRGEGLALRVRRRGRSFLLTLKAGDDVPGADLARGEWEARLTSAEPDLSLIPEDAAAAVLRLAAARPLQPVFTTKVRRQIRELTLTGADGRPQRLEAALDLGEIQANGSAQPIAELELELLEGDPAALYDLALQLGERTTLHLETRSKSARGYALATGEAPAWHKAQPLELAKKAPVEAALGVIFSACFGHWISNEAAALDGRDAEGVHQMRVGIRRLRSALSTFKTVLPESQLAWLKPAAKAAINGLGPARDWDVFLEETLAPVLAARPQDADLARLRQAALAMRAEAYEAARAAIRSRDYTLLVLRLGRWIETGGWRTDAAGKVAKRQAWPLRKLADKLLAKRHRQALEHGAGFAELSPEARHELRIALKKLRYAAEFCSALYDAKATKAYLGKLKALQDDLGHLNDVAVAQGLLAQLLARQGADDVALHGAAGVVSGWHGHQAHSLEGRMVADWEGFTGARPFWA